MRFARAVIPAFSGVAAGILSSFVMRACSGPPAAALPAQPPAVAATVSPAREPDPSQRREIAALSRRLEQLEDAGASAALASPPRPPPPEVDPEQHRAALLEAHERSIQRHWAEPADPAWSKPATDAVREDLQSVAGEKHFRVVDVDCRTSTCVSTVEWPDQNAAVRGYGDVLHVLYRANCARSIVLPDTADPSRPFRATLFLDCAEQRATGEILAF
jgi:hypothetical protein